MEIDGLVEGSVRKELTPRQFKYAEACRFKAKSLIYVRGRIEELDQNYYQLVHELLNSKDSRDRDLFEPSERPGQRKFRPFGEVLEFEHLLVQGKACLDCLAKVIGAPYKQSPSNLEALQKVLGQSQDPRARRVLESICCYAGHLKGLTLDPGKPGKKSLRDLITHRELLPIFFIMQENANGNTSVYKPARLDMNHREVEIVKLESPGVPALAVQVQYYTQKIFEECLKAQFGA
jgi:hypothetical protein